MNHFFYLVNPGTPLTHIECRNAFPEAWRRIPRTYREDESLDFFLTENGVPLCLWRSAPKKQGMQIFLYDRKNRRWKNTTILYRTDKISLVK